MTNNNFTFDYNSVKSKLQLYIEELLDSMQPSLIVEAMKYTLMSGGKRVRPMLLMEFFSMCAGDVKDAIPFAAALEMVHTYSLVHDDLPCMDDDDMRRGKPSCHAVFGEDIALLCGDALLTLAFETMLKEESVSPIGVEKALRAMRCLAKAIDHSGMILGQVMDLEAEGENLNVETLRLMDDRKTGDLITAACKMGCILASGDEKDIQAAEEYGKNIGLAFQVMDDILDSDTEVSKSDALNEKSTYVSVLGVDESRRLVSDLTDNALEALKIFEDRAASLKKFALVLRDRAM